MLTVSTLNWSPYEWCSKDPNQIGMKLAEAFQTFATAVNANPGNVNHQLSALKTHDSAQGATIFGYVWRLGHPVNPHILRVLNTTKVQNSSASTPSMTIQCGPESAWIDDTVNAFGGYGNFSPAQISFNFGLTYYGPSGSPASSPDGRLIVLMDTTPDGKEFFAYSIGTTSGDTYQTNNNLILFRSAGSSGWNVWAHRTAALAGLSEVRNALTWSNNVVVQASNYPSMPTGSEQLLSTGMGVYIGPHGPGQLFEYRTKAERITIPVLFWFGSNQISDPKRHGRVTNPGGPGTFYQLGGGASGAGLDIWCLIPPGATPMAGWNTIGSLTSWQTFPDRLNFAPEVLRGPVLMGPDSGPDFVMDWSPVANGAFGVAQHPLYSQQQGGGGGSRRPTTGVLWPRGN